MISPSNIGDNVKFALKGLIAFFACWNWQCLDERKVLHAGNPSHMIDEEEGEKGKNRRGYSVAGLAAAAAKGD